MPFETTNTYSLQRYIIPLIGMLVRQVKVG